MRARVRPAARPLLALGSVAACLLAWSAPAPASTGYGFLPPAFGSLTFPTGVAVDQANGNVYVVNGGGVEAVEVYGAEGGAPSGGAPAQLTGAQTPSGAFSIGSEPADVAIDNSLGSSGGEIYVTDVFNGVVDRFKLNGSNEYEYRSQLTGFSEPLGVAVDSSGNVFVADYGNDLVHEFNSAGEELTQYSTPRVTRPQSVAVDAAGDLFIQDYASQNLVELKRDVSGQVLSELELATSGVTAIAADQAGNRVFADFGTHVVEYDAAGNTLAEFGAGTLASSRGLAVNEVSGDVYASDAEGGLVDRFAALTFQDAFTAPASAVSATAATLNGNVRTNGIDVTGLQFEYGLNSSYGATVPASIAEVPGATPEAAVTASLTELEPNRTYHYRLTTTSASGESAGEDESFVTAVMPSVQDGSVNATGVTRRGALLSGTVNAENTQTTYFFEYGAGPGYDQSTIPASAGASLGDVPVAPQPLSELQPGTTYHYRLIATNAAGTKVGEPHSFTTQPGTPPIATSEAPEAVTQTTARITGTVDPRGLRTNYEFDLGTGTSYGTRVFASAGSGSTAEAVALALTGLAPGTTYHYRLIADNEDGIAYGADQTFTTPGYAVMLVTPPTPVLVAIPPTDEAKVPTKPRKPKAHAKKPKKPKKHKHKPKPKTKKQQQRKQQKAAKAKRRTSKH